LTDSEVKRNVDIVATAGFGIESILKHEIFTLPATRAMQQGQHPTDRPRPREEANTTRTKKEEKRSFAGIWERFVL